MPPRSSPRGAGDPRAPRRPPHGPPGGPPGVGASAMRYDWICGRRAAATRGGRAAAMATNLDDPRQRMKGDRTATYVYCAVRSRRPPALKRGLRGLPASEILRAVDVGQQLWLIVSDVPLAHYGAAPIERRLQDLDWVSRCAMAHEAVVEDAARSGPVVPMKLFTLFSTDDRAAAHVARNRKKLARLFDLVAGRQEWGVRMSLDERTAVRRRASAVPSAKAPTGTGFLLRKK